MRLLSKKDKVGLAVATAALLIFMVLFLMLPHRIVSDFSIIIVLVLAVFVA